MSRSDVILSLSLFGALTGVVLIFGVLVPDMEEEERRAHARAQRACAMRLAVSRTAADSLDVLTSTNWKVGCAYILAADTMPEAR